MIVIADTNALYGITTRELLLLAARAHLFTLYWSQQIADEAEHLKIDLPHEHLYPGDFSQGEPLGLPDPQDEHVLRLALTTKAQVILTHNLRDFPARLCHGIRCLKPDTLMVECLERDQIHTLAVLKDHQKMCAEMDWKSYCARLNRAQLHRLSLKIADL
jgi:hypothetical protein